MTSTWKRLLAVLFAFALVATACGGGSDGDEVLSASEEPAAASGAEASSGGGDRTGEVIKVGYVNNEGGALSLPEFRTGGEVAIEAINASGGINGAQIEVVTCLSDASPEGAINCANELIEEDVVLAYMGIELASEAAIGLWMDAGIPYISSNSWGPTEKVTDGAHLLHTASGAYAVGPAKTFSDLGIDNIAVILEDNPAARDFFANIITPVLANFDMTFTEISVDPAAPDWTAAVATAQAAGVDGIWGQLTEPGCIGMVGATSASGFDKPVFAGSCSFFISVLGEAAIGAYSQGDLYIPETRQFAPPEIQTRLDDYEAQMIAAGYEDQVNGFAVAPYSTWFEMAEILRRVEGEMTAEAVDDAFENSGPSSGWLGPDLHCGGEPWPAEPSHCGSQVIVWEVVQFEDGTIGRQPVGDGFFDAFGPSGF